MPQKKDGWEYTLPSILFLGGLIFSYSNPSIIIPLIFIIAVVIIVIPLARAEVVAMP